MDGDWRGRILCICREKRDLDIFFWYKKGEVKISILKNIEKKKSFEIRETNLLGTN